MAVIKKSEYEDTEIRVGADHDEDGAPLVVVDGKAIGRVDKVVEFLGLYNPAQAAGRLDAIESAVTLLDCRIGSLEAGILARAS